MRPKQWFYIPDKSSKSLKKKFSKKNVFQVIYVDMIFNTVFGIFFLNKRVSIYLSCSSSKVPKNSSSQENY